VVVQVAIVDDEALVRAALRSILESSGDIVVVADCDGDGALDAVTATAPDLVLLDAVMPGPNDGPAVLRALRALPRPPVVAMLTAFDTSAHIHAALAAGASGFLLKDTAVPTLIDAVHVLAGGGTVFTPTVARTIVDGYLDGPRDGTDDRPAGAAGAASSHDATAGGAAPGAGDASGDTGPAPPGSAAAPAPVGPSPAALTDREREVLALLAAGLPNAAIAAELRISVGTVKDHVRAVLRKLDAPNRVSAAVIAHRAGLARTPERP
jgi:DNA-binding NarL/FixJ family response regulator